MPERRPRFPPIAFVLLAYAALSAAYSVVVPILEVPDELNHVE